MFNLNMNECVWQYENLKIIKEQLKRLCHVIIYGRLLLLWDWVEYNNYAGASKYFIYRELLRRSLKTFFTGQSYHTRNLFSIKLEVNLEGPTVVSF